MDRLHDIVRRAAAAVAGLFFLLLVPVRGLAALLLGRLDWQPPGWAAWLRTRL
ncbi:MAG: hypothetical protein JNM82_07855, partial [Rhodocyclaceae bacterium]|nr:hypothetical protein [Rhodocyclaceae bacterium]